MNQEEFIRDICKVTPMSKSEARNSLNLIVKGVEQETLKRVVENLVFRDVEYTSLDRMSQESRDNYFYNLSLNQVKDNLLSSLKDTKSSEKTEEIK